jgi:hypothetical protein
MEQSMFSVESNHFPANCFEPSADVCQYALRRVPLSASCTLSMP